jgi:MFS family permease
MGLSFLEIGTLISIREIATNLMELPTGIMADAYGRRRSMIAAFLAYIISFTVFYFFPGFGFYAVAMIFFAGGEAFRTGTHKAMILDYLQQTDQTQHKVDYYGHTRSWSQRGSALSALLAAVLVLYSGSYRVVFLASAIPYIAALFLMVSYPRSLEGIQKGRGTFKDLLQIRTTVRNLLGIFKNRQFVRILFNSGTFDSVFKTVKDYIQPILQTFALALPLLVSLNPNRRVAILTGATYFILFLMTAWASASSGAVQRRIPLLPRALNIAYILGAGLVAATGIFKHREWSGLAIIFFILFYMLFNIRRPLSVGYVSEQISTRVMASGLSVESQLKTILVAVLAPLFGQLADNWGIGLSLFAMGLLLILLFPLLRLRTSGQSTRQI